MATFVDFYRGAQGVFSLRSMLDYVDKKPYIPQHFAKWLPWTTKGVYLNAAFIELREGNLSLIPEAPRGAKGDSTQRDTRGVFPVMIPHYPQTDPLLAESIRGVRAFGSELEQAFETERNDILDKQHNRNLLRWEYSKGGAITGVLLEMDADGNFFARYNWYDLFGVTRHEVEFDLNTASTPIVEKLIECKELSEEELGAFDANGYVLICGKTFFKKLTGHPKMAEIWKRWKDGEFLRADNREGFPIANDIFAVSYSRGKIAGRPLIADDEAYLCPIAAEMYQVRHAPGIATATLGQMGEPEYFSTELLPHDAGVELKSTTDVISYTQRPRAIIKLKLKP
ncbi:major capsid protein [uncultured Agrobacterium sp.]|uniref:major capsid protein n=1 Tax=uncultured Agrobacterium sp. TaxID=157277 RepID=UPI0025D47DEE|nr:major capsid protein [uncultured Agrobacterium sp.]